MRFIYTLPIAHILTLCLLSSTIIASVNLTESYQSLCSIDDDYIRRHFQLISEHKHTQSHVSSSLCTKFHQNSLSNLSICKENLYQLIRTNSLFKPFASILTNPESECECFLSKSISYLNNDLQNPDWNAVRNYCVWISHTQRQLASSTSTECLDKMNSVCESPGKVLSYIDQVSCIFSHIKKFQDDCDESLINPYLSSIYSRCALDITSGMCSDQLTGSHGAFDVVICLKTNYNDIQPKCRSALDSLKSEELLPCAEDSKRSCKSMTDINGFLSCIGKQDEDSLSPSCQSAVHGFKRCTKLISGNSSSDAITNQSNESTDESKCWMYTFISPTKSPTKVVNTDTKKSNNNKETESKSTSKSHTHATEVKSEQLAKYEQSDDLRAVPASYVLLLSFISIAGSIAAIHFVRLYWKKIPDRRGRFSKVTNFDLEQHYQDDDLSGAFVEDTQRLLNNVESSAKVIAMTSLQATSNLPAGVVGYDNPFAPKDNESETYLTLEDPTPEPNLDYDSDDYE